MLFLLDAPIGGGASGAPALDARSHREELIIAAGFAGCKETYDAVVSSRTALECSWLWLLSLNGNPGGRKDPSVYIISFDLGSSGHQNPRHPPPRKENKMTAKQCVRAAAVAAVLVSIVVGGMLIGSTRVRAQDEDRSRRAHDQDEENAQIQIGFDIAPVPLNLHGKDRDLVGLGSYIVNSVSSCNDCHSAGPQTQYIVNPYFGVGPKVVNPKTYLGGGRDFGPLIPGSADIVSRNLTPDKTGLPEGGRSFAEFVQIFRTGVDLDHLHPTCPKGTLNTNCVPFPFDGNLLQIMPWPVFQTMTGHDIRAIYEYLSAVPCIAGPPSGDLHNDCPE
jgi:hypothetical protein